MTELTLATFLTSIGSMVTSAVGWVSTTMNVIIESPVLLVMAVGLPLISFAVGLGMRFIHRA